LIHEYAQQGVNQMNTPTNDNKLIKVGLSTVGPLLAAIPVIGGSIATRWSDWRSDRRFARIEEAVDELQRLLSLPTRRIDVDALSNDDMQILEAALERVQTAHTEEKRKLFAHLVASCWTDAHDRPFDEKMIFVNALSEFNEYHLRTLAILRDANGAVAFNKLRDRVIPTGTPEIESDSVIIPILDTLAARYGFIRRAWGMGDPSAKASPLLSKNLSPEGIARGCNHAITPLGQRFMASISESEV
jgi:hypothetical protein